MRRYISTEPARLEVVKASVTAAEKLALQNLASARNKSMGALIRGLLADVGQATA